MKREHRLTVLAVDSIKARLALADVLTEDVTSTGLACQLADGIILAWIGVAGPFWTRRKTQKRKERRAKFNSLVFIPGIWFRVKDRVNPCTF